MLRKTIPMNNNGSVLVGAIALSVLMAIAGIGFLQVTAISVNSETTALINEKALQAAESGLWIGARWLRGDTAFLHLASGSADILLLGSPLSINGMDVYDTISVTVVAGIPVATIKAEAYKGGSTRSAATFKKRITYGDVRCRVFGEYGTFYDGFQSTYPSDFTSGKWNTGETWNGWGTNRVFNGRFHMNSLTNKLCDNTARFNGLVTVAKGAGQYNYGIGHDSNNYNYGVQAVGWTADTAQLNDIFTGQYIPNTDQIDLNIKKTDAASIAADASFAAAIINLPASTRDEGYRPDKYRPTLYFDGPNAFYEWKDAGGYHRDTIGPLKGGGTINGKIFLSHNNLNVYSTAAGATGRFTIATDSGRSIVPVGNLVTSDYDYTSGTVPSSSDNMIGLISGGNIAFNKTWRKRFSTFSTGTDTGTKYVSAQVTGGGAAGWADGAVGTLHMSAAIIAVKNGFKDTLYNGSMDKEYSMTGTEWWDGMWDEFPTSPNSNFSDNVNNHCEDYGFKLFGNHILGGYSRTIYIGGEKTRGCAGGLYGGTALEYTHDPRMYQRFLQPPAFPTVVSADGLLVLKMTKWSEENSY